MDNSFIALGLMSGTSLDGIDASIIKSDGENNLEIIDNKYFNYPEEFRKRLSTFILNINNKADIEKNIKIYKSLERNLTLYHSKISKKIISENKLNIQFKKYIQITLVPEAGLEPARYFYRGILSPLCLPIPPLGHNDLHAIYINGG